MTDQAWRIDLDGRINNGADDAPRPDALLARSPGIDRPEPRAFERAVRLVEILPGDAV